MNLLALSLLKFLLYCQELCAILKRKSGTPTKETPLLHKSLGIRIQDDFSILSPSKQGKTKMEKYRMIGSYIIEISPLDEWTYNIALWHVSHDSLDCELCDIFQTPTYQAAVTLWEKICAKISISVGGKNPCSDWSVSSTRLKDTDQSEKGFFPLLRESNPHE